MAVVAALASDYNRDIKGGAMLGSLFHNKQQRLFNSAVNSIADWKYANRPFLQLRALRAYEQSFVVQNYYRPCGYVWKQGIDKELRLNRAADLRNLSAEGRDIHYAVAHYGLLYRLAFFEPDDLKAIRAIQLTGYWANEAADADKRAKRFASAFDLLLLQHVVQGWQNLAKNAEFLLEQNWPNQQLKSLAADMALQAHYEYVRPKIFQNTLEPVDIGPAKKAADLAEKTLGQSNFAGGHYRALIAAIEGDLDEAVNLHAATPVKGYRTQFFRTAKQTEFLEAFKTTKRADIHWPQNPKWDRWDSHQTSCSLVACDEGYFNQFFADFAESFAIQNPGGLLHFHGVGFKPPTEVVNKRTAHLNIEVNISHDLQDVKALLPDRFKGYCAGARYMYLPFFLAHYDRVIIHDVDGVLTTDMETIWADNDAEVMISSPMLEANRRGHFALWSNIGAGAFAIRRTEGSLQFANALSHYLAEQFVAAADDQQRYFFSDQTGLLLATMAFQYQVNIQKMPQIFKQSGQHNGPGRGRAKRQAQVAALKKMR